MVKRTKRINSRRRVSKKNKTRKRRQRKRNKIGGSKFFSQKTNKKLENLAVEGEELKRKADRLRAQSAYWKVSPKQVPGSAQVAATPEPAAVAEPVEPEPAPAPSAPAPSAPAPSAPAPPAPSAPAPAAPAPVEPSPLPFYKSPVKRDNGSKQLLLLTNEYGFIEDIKYDLKRTGDNIVFPGIESCNGIIVVLIDKKLKKETKIFGYHRPPHVGDMIQHTNNDNKFLELIKDNIENPKTLAFFVVSLGFDTQPGDELIRIISENLKNLSILNLERNKSYKINENPRGVIFEQRLVETTTLTADWRKINEDTNCLVLFSPIQFFDYGWIIKQGKKTAQIRLS